MNTDSCHSLLKRQLRRCFGENTAIPSEWQAFVASVNEAYQGFDLDRELLERSMELSSHELNHANNQMRAIFQVLPDLLVRMDRDGTVRGIRGNTTSLLPEPQLQITGKRLSDTLFKPLWNHIQSTVPQVIQERTPARLEFALELQCQHYDFEVRLVPLLPDQVIAIVRDITEPKQAQRELKAAEAGRLELSRQAGMAEVAVDVLHNIGNVLNSVNVGSSCLSEKLRHSKLSMLNRVSTLLKEHQGRWPEFLAQDPRGNQVLEFLLQLNDHLQKENQAAQDELTQIQKHIDHIKDIVTMQQVYAKTCRLIEKLQLRDLVDDALKMQASALARHDIHVQCDHAPLPFIEVEKHKVIQILVNLVQNAKNACKESGHLPRRILIRTEALSQGGVRLLITDNGVGIPPENLAHIFQHGFTTRKDGHGFGLHSGSLTAREMGGELKAFSPGPGQGATFQLDLPPHPPAPEETPSLPGAPENQPAAAALAEMEK